jgi:RNA polymerase primary sigma factor
VEHWNDILNLRFGLDGKPSKTLKDIGNKYKICKERVRQIVRQSIIKAKIAVRDKRTKRLFQEAMYANPR